MPRYWVIAPFDARDPDWDAVWQFDLDTGVISIGWSELGDVSSLTEDQIYQRYQKQWPGRNRIGARMLHKFYQSIAPGDVVVARRGLKRIAAIGIVKRRAYYDPGKVRNLFRSFGEEYELIAYPNHLDVEWSATPRNVEFENRVFGMMTLYEIPAEKYAELISNRPEPAPAVQRALAETDPEEGVAEPIRIGLEKYLEDFVVTNFDTIFERRLKLYCEGDEEPIGQQYPTDVGIIDILAQDVRTNGFVVIELKKGRPPDKVVGQVLRYMGWVSEELCSDGQEVHGMIICGEQDSRLIYALKYVRNVSIKYYRVDFELLDEPPDAV